MFSVAIDYTPAFHQTGGIGRYVRELVEPLLPLNEQIKYQLFIAGTREDNKLPVLPTQNYRWATTPLSNRWLARLWHRAHIPYSIENWTGKVDIFHATDFVLPPLRTRVRKLLTVHDLSYIQTPEVTSPRLKRYLETVVPRSIARADGIIADSVATKKDIIDYYSVPQDKIEVLLSGVSLDFQPVTDAVLVNRIRDKYQLGDAPFLFTIGTVQPRKNYSRLILAFERIVSDFDTLQLVIGGGKGWLDGEIFDTWHRSPVRDRIHFIGYVDDSDLKVLLSEALIVPYVALYEGFGLPVLEAMACGTPVVSSKVSSIPEAAGEASIGVDPYDVEAIADALKRLLLDDLLRQSLLKKGFEQVKQFSWEKTAQQLLQIYEQLLA